MRNYPSIHVLLQLALSVCYTFSAHGQWSEDPAANNTVCTAAGHQRRMVTCIENTITDPSTIIVWVDERAGNKDIYIQRLNVNGGSMWLSGGVPVCTNPADQDYPDAIQVTFSPTDKSVLIVWQDQRSGNWDIYAQKMDLSTGNALWSADGVPACVATGDQVSPKLAGVGSTFHVAWSDYRAGVFDGDIYCQRMDPLAGARLWGASGTAVCFASGTQVDPLIALTETGLFVTWRDNRSGNYDIYAQNVNPTDGSILWSPTSGVAICTAPGSQGFVSISPLSAAGYVYVSWLDERTGSGFFHVYAQLITGTGSLQWAINGMPVATTQVCHGLEAKTGTSDELFLVWHEGPFALGQNDIKLGAISESGTPLWGGLLAHSVCSAPGDQRQPRLLTNPSGTITVAWLDGRNGSTAQVFAQRILNGGSADWTTDGIVISSVANNWLELGLTRGNVEDAVAVWTDYRSGGTTDIYAQNICVNGSIGRCPYIWTGNTNWNWDVPSNWNRNSVPPVDPMNTKVIISDRPVDPVAQTNINIMDLVVEPGAELWVQADLSVAFSTVNNGIIQVEPFGSLVNTGAGPIPYSGTGQVKVLRHGTPMADRFNYWSSPVGTANLPGTGGHRYEPTFGTHSSTDDNPGPDPGWVAHTGAMTVGRGYASRGAGYYCTFTGVPNNGTTSVSVTGSAQPMSSLVPGSRFNLVGNPYPCNLRVDELHSVNSGLISAAFYLWDDDASGGSGYSSSDYAVRTLLGGTSGGGGTTPADRISTCQGFFVEALSSGSLVFNNGQRIGGTAPFFRTDETYRKLWLSMDNGSLYNEVLIGEVPDATEERSTLYDAYKLMGNANISLAAQKGGEDFSIVAFPPVSNERIIPLTAFVTQTGLYTFRNKEEEGFSGSPVYLEDRLLGTYTPFSEVGDEYTAAVAPTDAQGRFFLHFGELVTDLNSNSAPNLNAYYGSEGLDLRISGMAGQNECTLTVVDMSGRRLCESVQLTLIDGRAKVQIPSVSSGMVALWVAIDGFLHTAKLIIP